MPMIPQDAIRAFRAVVGERNCITAPEELRTYECDGLTSFRATPGVVVLPGSGAEVVEVVKIAHAHRLPVVPRGSGTGLSGGALPVPEGVLVGLSRMKRILEIDLENGWMRVEPGVINLEVSRRLAPDGYYYAPDPSSQSVCSIGGDAAGDSGGAPRPQDRLPGDPPPGRRAGPPGAPAQGPPAPRPAPPPAA